MKQKTASEKFVESEVLKYTIVFSGFDERHTKSVKKLMEISYVGGVLQTLEDGKKYYVFSGVVFFFLGHLTGFICGYML